MTLIDDEGNLFGVVNVIDALVILIVLAVGVAGIALVAAGGDGDEPDEPDMATTYATLDLGTQPAYVVDAIQEGDTYGPDDTSTITITDVHVTPHGEDVGVTLRVELTGEEAGENVEYANAPLRLDRTLEIETDQYTVDGQIRAVGDNNTLDRTEETVVIHDTLDVETAESVTPGDEIRLAGRTIATIDDIRPLGPVMPTSAASTSRPHLTPTARETPHASEASPSNAASPSPLTHPRTHLTAKSTVLATTHSARPQRKRLRCGWTRFTRIPPTRSVRD